MGEGVDQGSMSLLLPLLFCRAEGVLRNILLMRELEELRLSVSLRLEGLELRRGWDTFRTILRDAWRRKSVRVAVGSTE